MTERVYYQHQLDIPVEQPPRRVVSLVPSMTESLFDLALGERVVGVTDYCVHPAEKLVNMPRIGGTKNPDVGKIIDLQPELVIANWEENRKEDVEALQEAGIPVWVTLPKTIPDVFNILWNLMYTFEQTAMVPRIRLIEYTYDWVLGVTKANEDVICKVFVPIWLDPLMTFNADTYVHNLLETCGGTNVFANRDRHFPLAADLRQEEALPLDDPRVAGRDTRYPRIALEEVVEAQPDVILLPSEPYAFSEKDITTFAALDVPAAHNNKIHLVDGSLLTWHGTRVAYALNEIPPLIRGTEDVKNDQPKDK